MNFKLYQRYKFIAFPTLPAHCKITVGLRRKNIYFENYVGWKMLKMVNLKMIERTFPPLNFWWE